MTESIDVAALGNVYPYTLPAGWTAVNDKFQIQSGSLKSAWDVDPLAIAIVTTPPTSGVLQCLFAVKQTSAQFSDMSGAVFCTPAGSGYIVQVQGNSVSIRPMTAKVFGATLNSNAVTYASGALFRATYNISTNVIEVFQVSISDVTPVVTSASLSFQSGMSAGFFTGWYDSNNAGIISVAASNAVSSGVTTALAGIATAVAVGDLTQTTWVTPWGNKNYVTITSVISTPDHLGGHITTTVGDRFIFDTASTLGVLVNIVDVDTALDTDYNGTQTITHWDHITGVYTQLLITTGAGVSVATTLAGVACATALGNIPSGTVVSVSSALTGIASSVGLGSIITGAARSITTALVGIASIIGLGNVTAAGGVYIYPRSTVTTRLRTSSHGVAVDAPVVIRLFKPSINGRRATIEHAITGVTDANGVVSFSLISNLGDYANTYYIVTSYDPRTLRRIHTKNVFKVGAVDATLESLIAVGI